ncbi:MAG: sel1 repeat family protein [Neisseriaceae bacterium]|nr:sel1 repeat family protein [Neisseriaceae bacterium]
MDEQFTDELQQAENEFKQKNFSAAFNIFFELAHKNCVQAQYRLAQMYDYSGNYYIHYSTGNIKENPQQAFYWYQKAAQNGHAFAQHNLAYLYEIGYGIEKDLTQSIYWYQKAADNGDNYAQNNLAHNYFNCIGVERDIQKAIKYWQLSANAGNEKAAKHLACIYLDGEHIKQDIQLGISLLKKSANKGFIDAVLLLGEIYEQGLYNIPKDEEKALKLYKQFIQNEDAFYKSEEVLYRIVKMYIEARGTEQNLKQAKKYLSKISKYSKEYKELKQLLNEMG